MSKLFIFGVGVLTLIIVLGIYFAGPSDRSLNPESSPSGNWVGKGAPEFELEDFDGNKVSLASLKGKKVVLFFSEGLMCYPACWDQMAKLGSDPRLNNDSVVSYSIIVDRKSDWQKAFEKMPELRTSKVLFDVYAVASRSYRVLDLPSSMHRGRFPGHTYFVLDRQGMVKFFYDDPQMGIRNDQLFDELNKIP